MLVAARRHKGGIREAGRGQDTKQEAERRIRGTRSRLKGGEPSEALWRPTLLPWLHDAMFVPYKYSTSGPPEASHPMEANRPSASGWHRFGLQGGPLEGPPKGWPPHSLLFYALTVFWVSSLSASLILASKS